MRACRLGFVALVVGGLLGACAHAPAPGLRPESDAAEPEPLERGLQAGDLGTQGLFRLQYRGPEGSGALRLILQLDRPERYRIETKDRFGRSLWRLDVVPGLATLIDDRLRITCSSAESIRMPEAALESLPLEALPAILLDRLPGDLRPLGAGEFRDREHRRWTARGSGAEIDAWTFWEGGEPKIWWTREASGERVLSHRGGAQLRWKRIAGEPLPGPMEELPAEPEYDEVPCANWPAGSPGAGGG